MDDTAAEAVLRCELRHLRRLGRHLRDSMPKGRVMFITNAVKTVGCIIMLFGTHPLLAYAIVGPGRGSLLACKIRHSHGTASARKIL